MANKSQLICAFLKLLVLVTLNENFISNGLSVDPPENLGVFDPGHFGVLDITWSPPCSLINMTDCSVIYQLEYYNTYKDRWAAVRTIKTSYRAQFDLMKDIQIRAYTLLKGPCTNNTMIQSPIYSELIQTPPTTGIEGTEAEDFSCVFQKMEYLECKWKRRLKMPANSVQKLYYWYKSLAQAEECPKYIVSGGDRTGCNFTGKSLPLFTDVNFSVNGSSLNGPLKPIFVSLQIQNHVKALATENLRLRTGPDKQFELHWDNRTGKVPPQCLEWEVEDCQEKPDGNISLRNITANQNSLILSSNPSDVRNCFRVRSKMHKYCAEKGIWSDWSHPVCHPEKIEVVPEPAWEIKHVYISTSVAIIAILMLCLCVWAATNIGTHTKKKKVDYLLTTLFNKDSFGRNAEVNKCKKICNGVIV